MSTSTLVMDREIYCPLDEVFAFHCDLTRAPEYWEQVSHCRRLDGAGVGGGVPGAGSRYGWRYTMLGRDFTGEFVVRECLPDARFVFDIRGGVRGAITHEYRATARTRTYVVVSIEYHIPLGVLGPAVNRLFVERHNAAAGNRALDSLQSILEARTREARTREVAPEGRTVTLQRSRPLDPRGARILV